MYLSTNPSSLTEGLKMPDNMSQIFTSFIYLYGLQIHVYNTLILVMIIILNE